MPATYVDQVQKLDIQSLMAKALKGAPADKYAFTIPMETWPPVEGQPDGHLLGIEIVLQRPQAVPANMPRAGDVLLKFTLPDAGKRQQILLLEGVPATRSSWRWKTICPYSYEHVQALYFDHSLQQFVSRKVAGLKYRAKLPEQGYRPLDRMRLHLRELEAKNFDPYIPKPLWMTEDRYQFLLQELNKEYIRSASALLGIPVMEFYDEYVEPDVNAMPERLPCRDPQSLAIFYCDRDGKLQIKAKYERKYGLPEGAAPNSPTLLWFAVPETAAK
jgi:hypothetical protein